MSAVLTVPTSIEEVMEWTGANNTYGFREAPDGTRWMLKTPYCSGEQGGAYREEEIARVLRVMEFLAYPVLAEKRMDDEKPKVALMHAEDANPGWKLLGTFSAVQHQVDAHSWLEFAAISVAFGIGDRHHGNVLLMQHEDTGQKRACSIDHECMCLTRECRPPTALRPHGVTHQDFLGALSDTVQRAKRTGNGKLLNDATIAATLDPEWMQFQTSVAF